MQVLVNLVGDNNLNGRRIFLKQWDDELYDVLGAREESHMR